jgi:DNA-binding response OmpR family regulator
MPARILVVDDERSIADTLTIILNLSGYDCRSAYDGAEALEAVDSFRPDLIISDVVMPKLDGIELYHRVKTLPNPPAVMLISGNANVHGMVEHEERLGCHLDVVAKPIPPPELLTLVSRFLQRSAEAVA